MYDKELASHILEQVLKSAQTIQKRFEPVMSVDDFTNTPEGMEKFAQLKPCR